MYRSARETKASWFPKTHCFFSASSNFRRCPMVDQGSSQPAIHCTPFNRALQSSSSLLLSRFARTSSRSGVGHLSFLALTTDPPIPPDPRTHQVLWLLLSNGSARRIHGNIRFKRLDLPINLLRLAPNLPILFNKLVNCSPKRRTVTSGGAEHDRGGGPSLQYGTPPLSQ